MELEKALYGTLDQQAAETPPPPPEPEFMDEGLGDFLFTGAVDASTRYAPGAHSGHSDDDDLADYADDDDLAYDPASGDSEEGTESE